MRWHIQQDRVEEYRRQGREVQGTSLAGQPRESLDLVHRPPEGEGSHRGGLRRTESNLERATKVQTLHFPEIPRASHLHEHPEKKRHHTFNIPLPGTDTATIVLRGRIAYLVVDVLHLREERDQKFLDKLRTLQAMSAVGSEPADGPRQVFHIEPAGMEAAALARILEQRRREVVRAFNEISVKFHQYKQEKILTVDDRDWAMTRGLTVKMNGVRISGHGLGSFSRLSIN